MGRKEKTGVQMTLQEKAVCICICDACEDEEHKKCEQDCEGDIV